MPKFVVSGISELNEILNKLSDVPDEVVGKILTEMGEEAKKAQIQVGREMNVYDPEWNGKHLLDSLKVGKPKIDGHKAYAYVTFSGTRTRANTKVRQTEIAFVNEFGADNKGIPNKQFIGIANDRNQDKIYEAGEKVWYDYLDSL